MFSLSWTRTQRLAGKADVMAERTVLVINTSCPEVDHLAAGLAEAALLSRYVRPYANLSRTWEKVVQRLPGLSEAYSRSFGRRKMPTPLGTEHLTQAAWAWDFIVATHLRIPIRSRWYRGMHRRLIYRRGAAVAQAGALTLRDEGMVLASWDCALPAFEVAQKRDIIRVLNYPFAHHSFSGRYLVEEAEREPRFAATINADDWPSTRKMAQRDREIELADYIIVGSTFAKDSFVAEGVPEHKLCIIPYGADTKLFTPPPKRRSTKHFNVLFAGQLTQRKGISYLLQAYERIQGPDTTLTMVGQLQDDGAALKPWRHLFRHVPHVPRPKLAELFQQADVFVFPTLVEGMGIVVLEAMASGLPVITTPNGPGDIVRDAIDGFLVQPRDVDVIADRLERLHVDRELRTELGHNARQRAEKYTWGVFQKTAVGHLQAWLDASAT
jgi:glycosyltransferase involved in cell wall biosynthesis